jgi:hypothetical protein
MEGRLCRKVGFFQTKTKKNFKLEFYFIFSVFNFSLCCVLALRCAACCLVFLLFKINIEY